MHSKINTHKFFYWCSCEHRSYSVRFPRSKQKEDIIANLRGYNSDNEVTRFPSLNPKSAIQNNKKNN